MKFGLGFVTMFLIASCLDAGPPGDEAQVSTVDQGIQLCSSTCDPPTYNGVAVGCASNTFCISAPEAAYCLQPDGSYFVAACVPASTVVCGDGVCSPGESCIPDCGAVCGDGVCSPGESCTADCGPSGPVCGNGICETGERRATCPDDCETRPCPTCPIP